MNNLSASVKNRFQSLSTPAGTSQVKGGLFSNRTLIVAVEADRIFEISTNNYFNDSWFLLFRYSMIAPMTLT